MDNRTASTETSSNNAYKHLYVFDVFQNLAKNKRLFTKGDIFTLLVSVVKCDAHVLNMALSTCKIPRQCITIPFDL